MLDRIIPWLPAICAVFMPVSFVIRYVFVYVCLVASWVAAAIVVYVRYLQISTFYASSATKLRRVVNVISLILGILACIGVSIVGNFQETRIIVGHLIGAALAFGCSAIYIYIQTVLSFRMKDLPGCTAIIRLSRVVIMVLHFICLVTTSVESLVSISEVSTNASVIAGEATGKWPRSIGGFTDHIVATAGEWLTALLLSAYFLTFTSEFRNISVVFMKVDFYKSKKKYSINGEGYVNQSFHI